MLTYLLLPNIRAPSPPQSDPEYLPNFLTVEPETCWYEFSYRRYTDTLLTYHYDEYANGAWNWW